MIRHILSFTAVGFLAAAVGAQGPKALTAKQKADLFAKNRDVIEKVVTQTVDSSKSPNDPLKRANSYYPLLLQFNQEINFPGTDSARIQELSQHLVTLLDKGLTPTLEKAKLQVEGGTGVDEFRKVKEDLLNQLNALLKLNVMSSDPAAKASLDGAMGRLNGIVIPEPK